MCDALADLTSTSDSADADVDADALRYVVLLENQQKHGHSIQPASQPAKHPPLFHLSWTGQQSGSVHLLGLQKLEGWDGMGWDGCGDALAE